MYHTYAQNKSTVSKYLLITKQAFNVLNETPGETFYNSAVSRFFFTYHGGFSNGAKAVDENVTGDIDWRTCRDSEKSKTENLDAA